jgi:hypothetical protein
MGFQSILIKIFIVGSSIPLSVFATKPPPRPQCEVKVSSTITVSGTLDGKGCVYTWRGRGYPKYCRAPKEVSEGLPPMFSLRPGATLKNMHIECALDGIHTSSNNVIDNIVNRDVEEDAITIGQNITIRNSSFFFCNDKCLQMNNASGVLIEKNSFFHSKSAVLANYGKNVTVRNNVFSDVVFSIRAVTRAGVKSNITVSGNKITGGTCGLITEKGSTIKDGGGNSFTNVKSKKCTTIRK